jgi:hypothetical protein
MSFADLAVEGGAKGMAAQIQLSKAVAFQNKSKNGTPVRLSSTFTS